MARSSTLTDVYVDGLNELLRDLRALPKDAAKELRDASVRIADQHMVPSWRDAAMRAGPWGPKLAESVKAKRDRVPSVRIGGNRKAFSGGATPNMVRYPSSSGEARESWAPFQKTEWIASRRDYSEAALREWAKAVDDICARW